MTSRPRWLLPLAVFGAFTVAGLSKFAHFWLDDLSRGHPHTLPARLIEELTGAYAAAIVFLVLVQVVYRFPLERQTWLRRLPGYTGLVVVLALAHTTLMWGSRELLFRLAGLGAYDYGIMQYRYPMEFALQAPNLAIMIGLLHAWRYYRGVRQRELRTIQLESELHRARLARLEAQLEPHFLFNTLNAISSLMYHDPARADKMMGRLSDLLRLTFDHPAVPEVPLAEELEWLGWYLEIMQLRFGDRLTIRQEIGPDTESVAVPRLVLQPLVENALKHGAAKHAGPSTVVLGAVRVGDRLRVTVEDDGPGVADPAAALRAGVGLSNTTERLRALYGTEAALTLQNRAGGGLTVTLDLPARAA
jgi:anti-sigma regulatory factor (Ser/Thr protein kinase)